MPDLNTFDAIRIPQWPEAGGWVRDGVLKWDVPSGTPGMPEPGRGLKHSPVRPCAEASSERLMSELGELFVGQTLRSTELEMVCRRVWESI